MASSTIIIKHCNENTKKWCVTQIEKWHKSPHSSTKVGWIGLKLYRIIEDGKNKIRHFDEFLLICLVCHNLSTHQKTTFPKYGQIPVYTYISMKIMGKWKYCVL